MDEIRTLKSELQGLMKNILSLDDFGDHVRNASDIKQNLYDFQVAILRLTDWRKNKPAPQKIGIPVISGVNLTQIEIPNFDGYILNWMAILGIVASRN